METCGKKCQSRTFRITTGLHRHKVKKSTNITTTLKARTHKQDTHSKQNKKKYYSLLLFLTSDIANITFLFQTSIIAYIQYVKHTEEIRTT